MALRWMFAFRVREWFLSPKDWDEYYDVGDWRETVSCVFMDSPDEEAARKKLLEDAEKYDIQLELLGVDVEQYDDPDAPQQPIKRFNKAIMKILGRKDLSNTIVSLANAMLHGTDCDYALRDALLEAGEPELAKELEDDNE